MRAQLEELNNNESKHPPSVPNDRFGDFEGTTNSEQLLELREICSQIDKDAFEGTKRLYDKLRDMEGTVTEARINHEQVIEFGHTPNTLTPNTPASYHPDNLAPQHLDI